MKRFHVHMRVESIDASVRFYSTLFAAEPAVRKPDYAKWMLDNPRVNFAISAGRSETGIHHLGMQVEDADELAEVHDRLKAANATVLDEGETECCYSRSEKAWISDPQGVAWETFLTSGESTVYCGSNGLAIGSEPGTASGCCAPGVAPKSAAAKSCCGPTVAIT